MVDIVIYTRPVVLEHKQRDCVRNDGVICFWKLSRMPKFLGRGERIFFAVKGFVKGSFEVERTTPEEIRFYSDTWEPVEEEISCKPLQGFKYRWFDVGKA